MAKTGFIATALLETSKGSIQPGQEVKGLPTPEMKSLRQLGVVEEDIIKATNEDAGASDPNGSQTNQNTDPDGDT